MTNTTILRVAHDAAAREAVSSALRNAGFGVVEADTWDRAAEAMRHGEAQLVVCDADAFASLGEGRTTGAGLPRDEARKLSHDLRTPLSAMAGWLHLIESGKLDQDGLKRALGKLRGNIEDQVKTIDRYLGANRQEGQR